MRSPLQFLAFFVTFDILQIRVVSFQLLHKHHDIPFGYSRTVGSDPVFHYTNPVITSRRFHGDPWSVLTISAVANNDDGNDNTKNEDTTHQYDYDLAIIGAGPVGVQAAIVAATTAQKKVVLIDAPSASGQLMNSDTQEDLSIGGPTGLFSKALRDSSKRIKVSTLRGMNLREDSIWNEITSACVELASFNARDIKRQLEYAGVTLIEGYAQFSVSGGSHQLVITADPTETSTDPSLVNQSTTDFVHTISADKILIATGSKPFRPSNIPFDGKRVFDSDSINNLGYLPKSVVITGSGIVAIEFAKIFSNLGCTDVTLLIRDNSPKNALMKIGLDKDVAATLVADLIQSGIKIERGCEVGKIEVPNSPAAIGHGVSTTNTKVPLKISLKAKGGVEDRPQSCVQELTCDAYIAAVGRTPNTDRLNLNAVGVQVDEYGGMIVDSSLRAMGVANANIYGAGDVLGRPFLASTGVAQGVASIQNMFGLSLERLGIVADDDFNDSTKKSDTEQDDLLSNAAACDPRNLAANPFAFPIGVWSSPEAAYYGLTVQQANEMGIDAGEGIALYAECLRGLVFNPNGLLKLVFERSSGRVVGVHICGDDACELIHYGMELVKTRRTIMDVANSLYSAVTYHEMYRIAAQSCMDPITARKNRAAAGRAMAERRRKSFNKI